MISFDRAYSVPWTFTNQEKYMRCFSEESFLEYIHQFGKGIWNSYFRGDETTHTHAFYDPLYFTLRYGYPKALSKLIELGAEIKHHAVDSIHPPLLPFFCSYARDFGPTTPLGTKRLLDMQQNKIEVLTLLLEHGVDIHAKDANNKTALEYAFSSRPYDWLNHYWNFIYLLMVHGADLSIRWKDGQRADELLKSYMQEKSLMQSCPLSAKEISFLKEKMQKSLHHYTPEELIELIERINRSISSIVWRERELALPYQVFDIEEYVPRSDIKQSLMQSKQKLIEEMHLFAEAFNHCGRQLNAIHYPDKEKLQTVINYLSQGSIDPAHAFVIQEAFQKLIANLAAKKVSATNTQLVPSSFYGKKTTRLVPPSEETLSIEQQAIKDNILSFFSHGIKEKLSVTERNIIAFLEGVKSIDDIGLTKEDARSYLTIIKIIDLALADHNRRSKTKIIYARTSDALRTKILELSSPFMKTSEAYTKTLDARQIKDRNFLSQPRNWTTERVERQMKILITQLIPAIGLSRRLNHYKPSIWAIRANTAVGKTRAVAEDHTFSQAIDETGVMSGVLNADPMKYRLKKKDPTSQEASLINHQVHEEGTALFKALMKGLFKNATHASLFIEGRFSTIEELDLNVFRPAKKRGGEVLLVDIEAPLLVSLIRVLTRDPFGVDPCPPLLEIIKGYKESILYRRKLIEIIKKEASIKYYKLYLLDDQGKRLLVAEKDHDTFKVFDENLLETSCRLPSEAALQQQIHQVISSETIEQALQREYIPNDLRDKLECWKGIPLGQAVEMHALGMDAPHALKMIEEERIWREKYGTLQLQPFDGWWLKDFPHIIDHLESEHLLHIRGVDEEGRGLHWQTNKFSWKLNPQFNPEAKIGDAPRGGLQMKVGYFIVPPAKIEKFTSLSLSPHILKELEVKDQKGELLGYRFFVHPEAYAHYRSLHDADIPFIKPEASTFMGTPTSSYRSWVIRNISDTEPKSIPFIVKLGVASTNTDTSRLLPKNDIQRSIQSQIEFDKMDKKSFNPSLPGSELLIFPENLGLILKDIPHYPPIPASDSGEPVDSGLIIREFPQELLEGKCKIFSFSSLMSVERMKKENQGICALNHEEKGFACLPLIYEVISATINKGLAKNSEEFFHTFLIQGYLQAMEFLSFHMGRSFSPHGQNLCLVLNQDNTPRGFAYRDHEGIFPDKEKGYIETFSWFYRYHVFVKLLNVIAQVGKDRLPHPPGAPTQVGYRKKLAERNLHHYLFRKCQEEHQEKALQILHSFGISFQQYYTLLGLLDANYLIYLSRYFDVAKAGIEYHFLPAAESGSSDENCLIELNRKLWKHYYLTENKGLL